MKATILLLVIAFAVAVTAQAPADEYTPAIMTPAPATLKKPIIFAPAPPAGTADADAPLFGVPPTTLKKANISENIYGGVIEFAKGRDNNGCRCRKQLPEKFRYDAQFKRERKVAATGPCGCAVPPPAQPLDRIPIIARFYPVRANTTNTTAPCPKPAEPIVQKIAPGYYPKRKGPRALAKEAAKNCPKPAAPAVVHIAPKFYPTRSERRARRKARAARKALKKKL
jgi:hypothetical protein